MNGCGDGGGGWVQALLPIHTANAERKAQKRTKLNLTLSITNANSQSLKSGECSVYNV